MNTPLPRREFAAQTATAIRAELDAKDAALEVNAAGKERLRTLASEIAEGEAHLDPDDLGAIQLLAAKREQHARLSTKFAADASVRLAAADKAIGAAMPQDEFAAFIGAEHAAFLEAFGSAVAPFFRERERVLRLARESDSGAALGRLVYVTANRLPLGLDETLAVLDGVACGRPPWIFP